MRGILGQHDELEFDSLEARSQLRLGVRVHGPQGGKEAVASWAWVLIHDQRSLVGHAGEARSRVRGGRLAVGHRSS